MPTAINPQTVAQLLLLRQVKRLGRDELANRFGVSASTASRIIARAGLPALHELDPVTGIRICASRRTTNRYEHEQPGDLIHIDVKKIGRVPEGGGWRIDGPDTIDHDRNRDRSTKLGMDHMHVAVDDHSRLAFVRDLPDEKGPTCAAFLEEAIAFFAAHGIRVRRVMTDNALNYARVSSGDWMTRWVATRTDLRRSTFDRLEGVVRLHIVPTLGPIAIGDLTRFDAQTWASKRSATQSPCSVRRIVNVLSAGLQVAVNDGRIPPNPASRLTMPRQSKRRTKFLTHQQVAGLAAAVDAKPAGEGYGLLVLVLAYTGLRWGELAGLRVRDLDFVRVRLDVHTTMVEVDGYMEESSPKDYEERSNVKALQRMLGHSSAKETLDTYSDLFDEDLDSVAVALNATGAALMWAKCGQSALKSRLPKVGLAEQSRIVGSFRGAPCRIRTDDPRFTRAVLWPTELRRRGPRP